MNGMYEGTEENFAVLDIKVKSAVLKRSTNSFYKMDPYWIIEHVNCEGRRIKTKKWPKGSKKPVWNHKGSLLIDEEAKRDFRFNISVFNKNSFGKDSLIGSDEVSLDYIMELNLHEGDFSIFHKGKEVGHVFLDLDYKDGLEGQEWAQHVFESELQAEAEEMEEEDLDYEYSPVKKPSRNNAKVSSDKVIAIDSSLSPLDANLALNKTPLWFKFNSSEVYRFKIDSMSYESVIVPESNQPGAHNGPRFLGSHIRATELPDASFLITGGEMGGSFDQRALHFFCNIFYEKSSMTLGRSNHSSVYHKGFVYWFGGRNEDGALEEWEAFDMNTDQWVPVPSMPRKRFNAGWCKFGDSSVYLFGGTQQIGYDEDDDVNIQEIDAYDITNYQWDTLSVTLNLPLALPICMQIGSSEVLVLGGREGNGVCKKDVVLININTLETTEKECMDLPCFSVYPPVFKNSLVYIQNSGTEIDNVPDPMIYPIEKLD